MLLGRASLPSPSRHREPVGVGKICGLEAETAEFYLGAHQRYDRCSRLLRRRIFMNVGLFPDTDASIDRSCQALISAPAQMNNMGVLGYQGKADVPRDHAPNARWIVYRALDPWFFGGPLALQLRFLSYVCGPCDCLMRPSPI